MTFRQLFIISAFSYALISCGNSTANRKNEKAASGTKKEVRYAKGFKIERFSNYTLISVRNPWDSIRTMETYVLVDRNKPIPANLPQGNIVKVPVQRVATCSAIFAGEYKKLGDINKIVAVGEPEYVYIPEITNGVASGKISNLGMNTALNAEKLIAARTDILVVIPFRRIDARPVQKSGRLCSERCFLHGRIATWAYRMDQIRSSFSG